MLSLLDIYSYIFEAPFYYLGVLDKPGRRFALVSGSAAAILWLVKPRGLFDAEGKPREWQLWSKKTDSVPLNWAAVSLGVGAMSILFIG